MRLGMKSLLVSSLPLALCFDTALLNEGLFEVLPLEVAAPGRALKAMLDEHEWLHFDREGESRWDADKIGLFTSVYLPQLVQFVTTAVRLPELLCRAESSVEAVPWPPLLRDALNCVVDVRDGQDLCPNIVPATLSLALPVAMAKADFMALRDAYLTFYNHHYQNLMTQRPSSSQWSAEATIFESVVPILFGARSISPLIDRTQGKHPIGFSNYYDAIQYDITGLPVLTKRLNELIDRLPQLFHGLKEAIEALEADECGWSWVDSACELWRDALEGALIPVSRIWDIHSMFAPVRAIREEFGRTLERCFVKLLAGRILLNPTVGEIVMYEWLFLSKEFVFDHLRGRLGEKGGAALALDSGQMEAFVAEQEMMEEGRLPTDGNFANGMADLTLLKWVSKADPYDLKNVITVLQNFLLNRAEAVHLECATIEALRETHGLTKRVVEAYEALLKMGGGGLEKDYELDLFLLRILNVPTCRETLTAALRLMRQIEGIPGIIDPVQVYDQNKLSCVLCPCFPAERARHAHVKNAASRR